MAREPQPEGGSRNETSSERHTHLAGACGCDKNRGDEHDARHRGGAVTADPAVPAQPDERHSEDAERTPSPHRLHAHHYHHHCSGHLRGHERRQRAMAKQASHRRFAVCGGEKDSSGAELPADRALFEGADQDPDRHDAA